MNNKITIDIQEILRQRDHSITDAETIRQIALAGMSRKLCIQEEEKSALYRKITPGFEYAGLYPYVMKPLNIKPEQPNDR